MYNGKYNGHYFFSCNPTGSKFYVEFSVPIAWAMIEFEEVDVEELDTRLKREEYSAETLYEHAIEEGVLSFESADDY